MDHRNLRYILRRGIQGGEIDNAFILITSKRSRWRLKKSQTMRTARIESGELRRLPTETRVNFGHPSKCNTRSNRNHMRYLGGLQSPNQQSKIQSCQRWQQITMHAGKPLCLLATVFWSRILLRLHHRLPCPSFSSFLASLWVPLTMTAAWPWFC